jgi:uridine phosphorylase
MPDEAPVLTAAASLEWRRTLSKAPPTPLPGSAVLTHQPGLLGRWRPWSRRVTGYSFEGRMTGKDDPVLRARCAVGGPATAVAIEEMAVGGVRRLILVDIAGSIAEQAASGQVVLVEAALASDGTSPHYSDGSPVRASEATRGLISDALARANVPFSSGLAWSTDAVYRELPSQLELARRQGALLADMEAATTLAVSAAVGIEAAAVLVVADELFGGWRPPRDWALVQSQLSRLVSIATACMTP